MGGCSGYLVDIWVGVGGLHAKTKPLQSKNERVARLGVTRKVPQRE